MLQFLLNYLIHKILYGSNNSEFNEHLSHFVISYTQL